MPRPALWPFVRELWFAGETAASAAAPPYREHTLPSGYMHLVFRLSGSPVRLFREPGDPLGVALGFAVVGGARSSYYIKEVCDPVCTVGAVLLPGASLPLFGAGAGELSGRHTPLHDLWGREAESARSRLLEEREPVCKSTCSNPCSPPGSSR
jgi:hypothetical protein